MIIIARFKYRFSLRIPTFADYPLSENAHKFIEYKTFHTPTSIQEKKISSTQLLQFHHYKDIIAPTGNGKTLSYMLPMFEHLKAQENQQKSILTKPNRPRGLVVVSSSQLVSQVVNVGKQLSHFYKLKMGGLHSGLSLRKQTQLLNDGLDVVAGTLQRIQKHRNDLYLSYLSHLVIDEMDTLIDGGNSDKIKHLVEAIKTRQIYQKDIGQTNLPKIIFVSATFTNQIDNFFTKNFSSYQRHLKFYTQQQLSQISNKAYDTSNILSLKKIIDKNNHVNLQNIKHQFIHCETLDKHNKILGLLKQMKSRQMKTSIIIFCSTIKSLHDLEYCLNQNKYQVVTLHGNLPRKMRFSGVQRFRSRNVNILLCTDLGSRGLDFPFVSHVINYDFPQTTSDYLHRTGRTGRAGSQGTVFSLYHNKDLNIINQLKASKQSGRKIQIGKSAYTYVNKEQIKNKFKVKPKFNRA